MGSLWNRSGVVERYADDLRASGAKAYFFLGGTNTPMTVYQDAGEAGAHPHPVVADANGRWPDVFVPYIAGYDCRVTSAFDVLLTHTAQIPNPNPVEVDITIDDPLEVVQTGMCHFEFVNTTRPGYVRANGKTMGNGASGGTERANADTQPLYVHLWDNLSDAVAPVVGGRGGSGASDFTANKAITLPNMRGAIPIGLDDMGNTAGGYFTGLIFGAGSAVLPGSTTGENALAITIANLPVHTLTGTTDEESAHTHSGTTSDQSQSHTHTGIASAGTPHQHNVYIHDPLHLHTHHTTTAAAGGGVTVQDDVAGGGTVNTDSKATGIRARSTPGAISIAGDDLTATESVHTHPVAVGDANQGHNHSITTGGGTAHSHTFETDPIGSGTPINNLPRSVLVTWYIRL